MSVELLSNFVIPGLESLQRDIEDLLPQKNVRTVHLYGSLLFLPYRDQLRSCWTTSTAKYRTTRNRNCECVLLIALSCWQACPAACLLVALSCPAAYLPACMSASSPVLLVACPVACLLVALSC